jgi:hypothetical protein
VEADADLFALLSGQGVVVAGFLLNEGSGHGWFVGGGGPPLRCTYLSPCVTAWQANG